MLTKEKYEEIRAKVLLNLGNNLPADLLYHCADHTIDVEAQAERIAANENISNGEDLLLLKIACLYHDCGFLFTYQDHEAAGCDFARRELTEFGISSTQIDIIAGMIMATRIPQTPSSKLEEIICDADLDYLGRDDFFEISNNLFEELKARTSLRSEGDWNRIQINFFRQHHYFTATAKNLRAVQKQKHLEIITSAVENTQA